jgi:hypothetical protein
MTIFLLCLNVAVVVGGVVYLDQRFRSHVNKLLTSGCPMADTERTMTARLEDIDRKLDAHESQMGGMMDSVRNATSTVNAMAAKEQLNERIKTAPAHRLSVPGL